MKLLIITDTWNQVNGVVTTLKEVGTELAVMGHEVYYITPDQFKTFSAPTYKEVKLPYNVWQLPSMIKKINADAIHIATEGTLGITARLYCSYNNIPFTSSFHTKMAEYISLRYPIISTNFVYSLLRWLHRPSKAVLVTTDSMKKELEEKGFKNLIVWSRGTNFTIFNPYSRTKCNNNPKVLLYVGRISVEKNIEAFLDLEIPNTRKIVVGDGPERDVLAQKYKGVEFLGYKHGPELGTIMANADVFVFPSKTDTFGIVMIEAAACGTPVAAFPVTGPKDFVVNGTNGFVNDDLAIAVQQALSINRQACYEYTRNNYSWRKCAEILLDSINEKENRS